MYVHTYVAIFIVLHMHNDQISVMLTEFRTNGNWISNVPVHPGLLLHNSQPDCWDVSKCSLPSASELQKCFMII